MDLDVAVGRRQSLVHPRALLSVLSLLRRLVVKSRTFLIGLFLGLDFSMTPRCEDP